MPPRKSTRNAARRAPGKSGARGKKASSRRAGGARPSSTRTRPKRKPADRHAAALERLRAICLALPQAHEVQAWGEPTFRVKDKLFAMHASATSHHGGGRPAVWIYATHVEQDLVIRARPDRYFKPPYVGPSGWIGAWLDGAAPWGEIAELLRGGWRLRAPKKLAAELGD